MTPEQNAQRCEKIRVRALNREAHKRLERELRELREAELLAGTAQTFQADGSSTSSSSLRASSSPLDLSRLRAYAACPENGLAAIAHTMGVKEMDILAAIAPRDWLTYQREAIAMSAVKRNASLTRKAETADLKALEFLEKERDVLSAQDWDALAQWRRIQSMTDAELEEERAKLRAVVDAPRAIEERHRLPPTIHIVGAEPVGTGPPEGQELYLG